jgi:hypothetical protein
MKTEDVRLVIEKASQGRKLVISAMHAYLYLDPTPNKESI